MNATLRNRAVQLSGILGFIVPAYFGWTLYVTREPQNIATWGMALVLDALGVVLAYRGGNKEPYMQLGWTGAAACIVSAMYLNGQPTTWGWIETVSVLLCGVAVYLWVTRGALKAQLAYMAAMYTSFVPLGVNYWTAPQSNTLWVWELTIVTCLLAILGAKERNFANTFVAWGAIGLNAAVVYLCLR